MCGRFTVSEPQKIKKRFDAQNKLPLFEPSWNVAPGQIIPTITRNSPNKITMMLWGLTWGKVIRPGPINIRSETFVEKPFFKHLLLNQRCLIVADSFYEWGEVNLEGKLEKYPFNFYLEKRKMFAFAGIYNNDSCALITTVPNKLVSKVHNRMPVILRAEDEDNWLDPKNDNFEKLSKLLKPFPANEMQMHIVSKRVNNPRNNNPDLIKVYDNL